MRRGCAAPPLESFSASRRREGCDFKETYLACAAVTHHRGKRFRFCLVHDLSTMALRFVERCERSVGVKQRVWWLGAPGLANVVLSHSFRRWLWYEAGREFVDSQNRLASAKASLHLAHASLDLAPSTRPVPCRANKHGGMGFMPCCSRTYIRIRSLENG